MKLPSLLGRFLKEVPPWEDPPPLPYEEEPPRAEEPAPYQPAPYEPAPYQPAPSQPPQQQPGQPGYSTGGGEAAITAFGWIVNYNKMQGGELRANTADRLNVWVNYQLPNQSQGGTAEMVERWFRANDSVEEKRSTSSFGGGRTYWESPILKFLDNDKAEEVIVTIVQGGWRSQPANFRVTNTTAPPAYDSGQPPQAGPGARITAFGWLYGRQKIQKASIQASPYDRLNIWIEYVLPDPRVGARWEMLERWHRANGTTQEKRSTGSFGGDRSYWESTILKFDPTDEGMDVYVTLTQGSWTSERTSYYVSNLDKTFQDESVGKALGLPRPPRVLPHVFGMPWEKLQGRK